MCLRHIELRAQARSLCKGCYEKWKKSADPGYHERQKASCRRYQKEHKSALRLKKAARRYQAPIEYVAALYTHGCCEICNIKPAKLNIDHCHKSGKIRGILCTNCNLALGYIEAGFPIANAQQYLEKYK